MRRYDFVVEVGCFTKFEYKETDIHHIDYIIKVINDGLSKEDRERTKYTISPVNDEPECEECDEIVRIRKL